MLNQTHSYDKKKVKHLGKLFSTIDFEVNENFSSSDYKTKRKSAIVGKFLIGNREYKINIHELERILETVNSASEVIRRKYRTGLMY